MFSGIFDAIETWLKGLLISTINSNLTTMFADINAKTGDIAAQVGQTPQEWNSGIFSMIQEKDADPPLVRALLASGEYVLSFLTESFELLHSLLVSRISLDPN